MSNYKGDQIRCEKSEQIVLLPYFTFFISYFFFIFLHAHTLVHRNPFGKKKYWCCEKKRGKKIENKKFTECNVGTKIQSLSLFKLNYACAFQGFASSSIKLNESKFSNSD